MDLQRSTQRWERLRQAAESKEFLIEKTDDSWDHRVGHDAGDDLLMERREPLVRRWRRLKAVSMVVFSGRPAAYKMVRYFAHLQFCILVCSIYLNHLFTEFFLFYNLFGLFLPNYSLRPEI